MDNNAEAGPSRLRPQESTPPTTPTASTKTKRRSWLGLASPVTPLSKESQEKRRNSTGGSEELGLGLATMRQNAAPNVVKGSKQKQSDSYCSEQDEDFGTHEDLEQTVKKKKKKKRRSGAIDELLVTRMEDLEQRHPSSIVSDKTVTNDDLQQTYQITTPRTFKHSASDGDPFISSKLLFPSAPSISNSFSGGPDLPPTLLIPKSRSSSLRSASPTATLQTNKNQPPLPVDVDRPLPPLPSLNIKSGSSLEVPSQSQPAVAFENPLELGKDTATKHGQDDGHRSRSASSRRSKGQFKGRRISNSEPSKTLGLGLPSVLLNPSRSVSRSRSSSRLLSVSAQSSSPPPLPSKPHSVSTPLPSRPPTRSVSPRPTIAFVEPQELNVDKPKKKDGVKRIGLKRAESLSGLFGKPVSATRDVEAAESSRPLDNQPQEDTELDNSGNGGAGKMSVLEWLGVKKTVKRKVSENKLRRPSDSGLGSADLSSQNGYPQGEEFCERENSIHSTTSSRQGLDLPVSPLLENNNPLLTSQPGPKKFSMLFSRRSSAQSANDQPEALSVKTEPRSIPGTSMPPPPSPLSQVSFNLLHVGSVSPIVAEASTNMSISSPGTENDEFIFSSGGSGHWGPGMRPWMDAVDHHISSRSSVVSTLDTLLEQEQISSAPEQPVPAKAPTKLKEGRARSWSDAPLPQNRQLDTLNTATLSSHERSDSPSAAFSSPLVSPMTLAHSKIESRHSSGNSAILGRMKNVFQKPGARTRSNSLLRHMNNDVDEFGGLIGKRMRPSASTSSMRSREAAHAETKTSNSDAGLQPDLPNDRRGTTERPSRSSLTPSLSSNASSTQHTTHLDPSRLPKATTHRNRTRASTVSLAPTSYHFAPSPITFPTATTPPRRRGTIRRLSNGFFRSGSPSPQQPSLFPLPRRSSGSASSSATGLPVSGSMWEDGSVGVLSPNASPRPSTGSLIAKSNAVNQISTIRDGEESPKQWLDRVTNIIGRNELAGILASSGDNFHMEALQLYMSSFDFTHNALDVALRKLLMHMALPKETQQIDRVIEAFAKQYEANEPGLFTAKDNTYVLAFSMMMLHTDAFNKNNKNKMTKVDYVRNSRMDGVPPFVLETFFDNITFTPFVFIEDDTQLQKQSSGNNTPSTLISTTPTFSTLLTTPHPNGKPKIDVYDLIVRDALNPLRVDVSKQIPAQNPYSCLGTRSFFDFEGLSRIFASAHKLLIPIPQKKGPGKLATPSKKQSMTFEETEMSLRVTKVGLISRKDEGSANSGKKSSRRWRSWSLILTQSQLLFFKDPLWALTLLEQIKSNMVSDEGGHLLLPRTTVFKPDEVFPVKDCIAVFDRTCTLPSNTFRFVISQTQQYLMQAPDESEMNEWTTLINYASAFRSAGIKMRSGTMRKDHAVLAGAAAAASHQREVRRDENQLSSRESGCNSERKAVFWEAGAYGDDPLQSRPKGEEVRGIDVDGANEQLHEGEQLEEVFGAVKAELAAGRGIARAHNDPNKQSERSYNYASRLAVIQNHIRALHDKETVLASSVRSSLLLARNIHMLTPFQKSTRDRLASFVPSIARRVRNERVTLAKFRFWISALKLEAERAEEEWKEVRHVALQAAARSLREDGIQGVVQEIHRDEYEPKGIPVLELPQSEEDGDHISTSPEDINPGELPVMFRSSSDSCVRLRENSLSLTISQQSKGGNQNTSYQLPNPHGRERQSSDAEDASVFISGVTKPRRGSSMNDHMKNHDRQETETSIKSGNGNTPSAFVVESSMESGDEESDKNRIFESQRKTSSSTAHKLLSHVDGTKEEAEDWQKTKAARRVSLVSSEEIHDWANARKVNAEYSRVLAEEGKNKFAS
ncbi:uncharacterized protein L203_104921 [Cryptococcus depauperatus CBS 7841]|uniref:ARF guanyl-nucleotide exchange factor n=1 Tax=Cryptococcus depauperatus CBS 7841 TaxID=1295531 RepID=A0AAJ8JWB0_9TREE